MWLKATRGLKSSPPPSVRVSDVLTACREGRAPAAGSKWPAGPLRVGAACPCTTPRGPRLSLAGCPRLVRTYGCACPPRTCAAAGGRSSGGGRIHPLVSDVLPAETAASGGRSAALIRMPEREHSFEPGRGSLYLLGAVLDTWGWETQAQGRRPRRVATQSSAVGLGSRANDLATSSRHR